MIRQKIIKKVRKVGGACVITLPLDIREEMMVECGDYVGIIQDDDGTIYLEKVE